MIVTPIEVTSEKRIKEVNVVACLRFVRSRAETSNKNKAARLECRDIDEWSDQREEKHHG